MMKTSDLQAIREIRNSTGLGLSESRDFFLQNPDDWEERLKNEITRARQKHTAVISDQDKCRNALVDLYVWRTENPEAYPHRELAAVNATIKKIEEILRFRPGITQKYE